MAESIGMMEGAFFVSKKDILTWINTTFKLEINDIIQAANGAIYCQIVDAIHPNKVRMAKVNWKAKHEHEIIQNYKLLQQAFTDCKINKHLDVDKLVKGRTQENLELLQWLKKYFEVNNPGGVYDAEKRRKGEGISDAKSRDTSKNRDVVKKTISRDKVLKTISDKENFIKPSKDICNS
jgi:RP/EB family microtubule-associated protein